MINVFLLPSRRSLHVIELFRDADCLSVIYSINVTLQIIMGMPDLWWDRDHCLPALPTNMGHTLEMTSFLFRLCFEIWNAYLSAHGAHSHLHNQNWSLASTQLPHDMTCFNSLMTNDHSSWNLTSTLLCSAVLLPLQPW